MGRCELFFRRGNVVIGQQSSSAQGKHPLGAMLTRGTDGHQIFTWLTVVDASGWRTGATALLRVEE